MPIAGLAMVAARQTVSTPGEVEFAGRCKAVTSRLGDRRIGEHPSRMYCPASTPDNPLAAKPPTFAVVIFAMMMIERLHLSWA
jgi:hypothetical protein